MDEPSLIFPAQEYRARIARLQAAMAKQGLDALLLTSPADVFYTTGFLTRFWESPARPWFVVVPIAGDPVAVIPSIGADLMGRTWLRDIRTWDAPDPHDDGVSLLADALAQLVAPHGQIGVPMGLETHLRMPSLDFEAVRTRLAPRRFVDATACVQRVREVKSEAEIGKIRASCTIAARAFDRVPEFARVGLPLADVFRDFQIALLSEGADWVSYVAGGAGRDGYGDVISPAGIAPLQRGHILMLDTGAVKDGYFCDFDRNFAIGPASDIARRAYAALWHATEDTLAVLRPGMLARDVHHLLSVGLRRRNTTPGDGRLGHGLGITLTEWPSFTPLDETPLREGMVLTLEPGCVTTDGRIMVHEENIVLRADGAELLSPRAPQELPEVSA
ncbi:Xaa-Pro peptidase family protein [Seohaeicola saemankumensis]|uniref:M24 family metallopeptidase n=1 Tax=Seohaeicola saemankumensis TaxID=481181 RepID=UPI001E421050|nr:Xaa-Pro peptidase family protein [Seohaeicola saemankumensis]MCD1625344.1 Xaa-Pro peptidase family protein [Seohaeicola saemankumensis]